MVHINPIFPYPGYVPDKPPSSPAEGTGRAAFKNNSPAISRELQADILEIRNRYERIAKPVERLGADVNKLDLKVNNKYPVFGSLTANNDNFSAVKTALGVLSPIPTLRRINSLPDELEDQNYSRAAGVAALAAINIPGDWRELKLAVKNPFVYQGQHSSTLAKGTFLNSFIKKNKWLKDFLRKFDKTLYHTDFGDAIKRFFNVTVDSEANSLLKGVGKNTKNLKIYNFTGDNLSKLVGRTLLRIPILGLAASSLFEIPALIESTQVEGSLWDKTKSFCKQFCKSASHITLVNGAIALGGAMLVPFGFLPALLGMAAGSVIGLYSSQIVREQINKSII